MNHVHEFIEAEVLAPLPENLQFPVRQRRLGTVTADLAAEITGEPASAELLERHFDSVLIHDVGLDTYHFHPLLMECARNIYMRQDPQRLQNITGKAALWHLERGHLEQAVHLAPDQWRLADDGPGHLAAARLSLLQGPDGHGAGLARHRRRTGLRSVPELSLTAAFAYLATGNLGKCAAIHADDLGQRSRRLARWRSAATMFGPTWPSLIAIKPFWAQRRERGRGSGTSGRGGLRAGTIRSRRWAISPSR